MKSVIKKHMLKFARKLIQIFGASSLLGFLGSCIEVAYGVPDYPVMYGTYASYLFKGTVTGDIDGDGATEPVPNIKITLAQKKSGDSQSDEEPTVIDETVTNDNGLYEINADEGWGWRDSVNYEYTITFSDEDGEENGSFETTVETIRHDTYPDSKEDEINVTLTPKPKA